MKRKNLSYPPIFDNTIESNFEKYSTDAYICINKNLLRRFGPEPTIYICNLIDKRQFLKQTKKISDEWFFHTHEEIEAQTKISIYSIRKCKKLFIDLNILETQMQGIPAKEFFKINIRNLIKEIDKFSTQIEPTIVCQEVSISTPLDLSISTPHLYDNNKDNNNKDNISVPANKVCVDTMKNERIKKFTSIAQSLANLIQSQKNIKITGKQISSWANSIGLLESQNKVSKNRIIQALKWYKQHIGEPFVPVIESGQAFKDKFIKLESAIKRSKESFQKQSDAPQQKQIELTKSQEHDLNFIKEILPDLLIDNELIQNFIVMHTTYDKAYETAKQADALNDKYNKAMAPHQSAHLLPVLFKRYAEYLSEIDPTYVTKKAFQLNSPIFKKFHRMIQDNCGINFKME